MYIFQFVGGWEINNDINNDINNSIILNDLVLKYDKIGKYRNGEWFNKIDKNKIVFLEENLLLFGKDDIDTKEHKHPNWRYGSLGMQISIGIKTNTSKNLNIQKVVNHTPHYGTIMSYYIWKSRFINYHDSSDTDDDSSVIGRHEYNEPS